MLKGLAEQVRAYNPGVNFNRLTEAFAFVEKKYRDLNVSTEASEDLLKLFLPYEPDENSIIAAAAFHLFDSGKLDAEAFGEKFGSGISQILFGIKKLESLKFRSNDKSSQMEVLRKTLLAMAKDIRVVLLWLVLNLYWLNKGEAALEQEENLSIFAKEVLEIYVPIASRLGIYNLKTQLEDSAFRVLEPEEYENVSQQLERFGKSQKNAIIYMKRVLQDFLKSKNIEADISGRFKSVYSVYKKLRRKNLDSVDELYDVFALRVVVPSKFEGKDEENADHLYAILGLIHSEWKPISKRFKDYLAVPKPNGYRSLHTVILGLAPRDMERPVEIQIRTESMHKEAEFGQASHWIYKQGALPGAIQAHSQWVKGLQKFHEEFAGDSPVSKDLQLDIFQDRIFVLTPRGEVKDLPANSTPLDFAYSVHTDIGNRCVMAKVNGVIAPLDSELKNGDVVEVVTRKDAVPKLQWLSIVRTNFAKNKIKAYFGGQNTENNLKEGKRIFNEYLLRLGKPALDQTYSVLKNYNNKTLTLKQREDLVKEVGKGAQMASDIIKKIFPYNELVVEKPASSAEMKQEMDLAVRLGVALEKYVLVGDEEGLPVRFASCCKPKNKDKIVAYVTRGNKMAIHRANCARLESLDERRIISASWKGVKAAKSLKKRYQVKIRVSVLSRVGLIRDLSTVISEFGISIVDIHITGDRAAMHEDHFLLEMEDLDQLDKLLSKLEQVKGVIGVAREE